MNYVKQLYYFDKTVAGKLTYTHAHMHTHTNKLCTMCFMCC